MISPTIVLVVGLALALVSLIVIAVCVIKSMLRPVLRSGMQLVVALACIPIALLLSKLLCKTAVDAALGMIDPALLEQILSDLPSGQAAVEGLAQIVAAPFLFTVIYFLLWVILGATVGIIVRSMEKGGSAVAEFKNKGIGAGIGAVCGLVLLVVYMMPLVGFTGMVPDVMDVVVDVELSEGEPLLDLSEQDQTAIRQIVNTPALAVPRVLGSKAIFDAASTTRLEGEKMSLTGEVKMLANLASAALPIAMDFSGDMSNIDEADVALLQEKLPEAFENSALLRVLGAEALSGFSNAWLSGKTFLDIEKPQVEGVGGVIVDSALALFKDTTKDTVV